jgi:hypothetical protein
LRRYSHNWARSRGKLGQQTLEILAAAKQGNYQPLADARTKGRPLEGALSLVESFLSKHLSEDLLLLGTVPSSYAPDALDTLVTTESQDETLLFVWKNGTNIGCGVLEETNGLSSRCRAYRLGIGA